MAVAVAHQGGPRGGRHRPGAGRSVGAPAEARAAGMNSELLLPQHEVIHGAASAPYREPHGLREARDVNASVVRALLEAGALEFDECEQLEQAGRYIDRLQRWRR